MGRFRTPILVSRRATMLGQDIVRGLFKPALDAGGGRAITRACRHRATNSMRFGGPSRRTQSCAKNVGDGQQELTNRPAGGGWVWGGGGGGGGHVFDPWSGDDSVASSTRTDKQKTSKPLQYAGRFRVSLMGPSPMEGVAREAASDSSTFQHGPDPQHTPPTPTPPPNHPPPPTPHNNEDRSGWPGRFLAIHKKHIRNPSVHPRRRK